MYNAIKTIKKEKKNLVVYIKNIEKQQETKTKPTHSKK